MKAKKDLNYYKNLNYSVILRKEGGLYYLFIAELSLIVDGKTPDEAYRRLEQEKTACFERAASIGVLDTLREPAVVALRKKMFYDLVMFFSRTLIIVSVCAMAFVAVLPFVQVFLVKGLTQVPMKELTLKAYHKLENMSDAQKEEARLKLRKVLQSIKPFVDEVRDLTRDEDLKIKARH